MRIDFGPSKKTPLSRIGNCITDLSQNGIDLAHFNAYRQARLVRQHLEYFQLMLGDDSEAREVLDLIRKQRPKT